MVKGKGNQNQITLLEHKDLLLRTNVKCIGWKNNNSRQISNCLTQETNKDPELFVVLGIDYGFGKERSIREANNQGKNQWCC